MKQDDKLKQSICELLQINNEIGTFMLKKGIIGEGGTSVVREATYGENEQAFAIKFLILDITKKESRAYLRFKQAYLNLANVQHIGGILPSIYFGTTSIDQPEDVHSKIPYIIMRKADGVFAQKFKDHKVPFELFECIFNRLSLIIEQIHNCGIIHRDIKPENIFIIGNNLYLGDFDIAKFDDSNIRLNQTQPNERLSNYYFSAPEQSDASIENISNASDWYAFAQVMHWTMKKNTIRGLTHINLNDGDTRFVKYNELFSKLLQNSPMQRLNSRDAIMQFLKDHDTNREYGLRGDQMWKSVNCFEQIIHKYMCSTPFSITGVIEISEINEIKDILTFLKDNIDKLDLIVTFYPGGSLSDFDVSAIEKTEANSWLLDYNEIAIASLYMYKHHAAGGSFLIIKSKNMPASGIYPDENEYEEVALLGEDYISRAEYDAGWAKIKGNRIKLEGKAKLRCRYLSEALFFIAPKSGPLFCNEGILKKVYEKFDTSHSINDKDIKDILANTIKRNSELLRYD